MFQLRKDGHYRESQANLINIKWQRSNLYLKKFIPNSYQRTQAFSMCVNTIAYKCSLKKSMRSHMKVILKYECNLIKGITLLCRFIREIITCNNTNHNIFFHSKKYLSGIVCTPFSSKHFCNYMKSSNFQFH